MANEKCNLSLHLIVVQSTPTQRILGFEQFRQQNKTQKAISTSREDINEIIHTIASGNMFFRHSPRRQHIEPITTMKENIIKAKKIFFCWIFFPVVRLVEWQNDTFVCNIESMSHAHKHNWNAFAMRFALVPLRFIRFVFLYSLIWMASKWATTNPLSTGEFFIE